MRPSGLATAAGAWSDRDCLVRDPSQGGREYHQAGAALIGSA